MEEKNLVSYNLNRVFKGNFDIVFKNILILTLTLFCYRGKTLALESGYLAWNPECVMHWMCDFGEVT